MSSNDKTDFTQGSILKKLFWFMLPILGALVLQAAFGCVVFLIVMFKGDVLAEFFSNDAAVIQKGFDYLKGFAPETIVTAILFSMIGYFNGNNKTYFLFI